MSRKRPDRRRQKKPITGAKPEPVKLTHPPLTTLPPREQWNVPPEVLAAIEAASRKR
jgi:hypothetical protein